MKDVTANPPQGRLPLQCVLANATVVMDQLGDGISTLENDVLLMIKHEKVTGPRDLAALQQFDFLLQTAREMSLLMSRLSDATGTEAYVQIDHVIAPIKLAAVRTVVGLSQSDKSLRECRQQTKDIQLF